jgi:hypothetical protein
MNRFGLRTVVFLCLFLFEWTANAQFLGMGGGTLDAFVPAVGPNGSTPTIIRQDTELFVSGYTDSILVLYRDESGNLVASVQMREMTGQLYDVEQNVRLNEPSKTFRDVVPIELDYPMFQYSRINNFEESALFVNFFHIFEDEMGNQHLDTHWANKSPYVPAPDQKVYHILTNSFYSGNEQALTNLVLDEFSIDTYEENPILPEAYITESHTFNNEVHLMIDNKTDNTLEYTLEMELVTESSVLAAPTQQALVLQPGENEFVQAIPPFLSAKITLIDENEVRVDQIRTFDGGWVNESQGIDPQNVFFSTQTCNFIAQEEALRELDLEDANNILLSGCAIQRSTTENENHMSIVKRMIVSEAGAKSLVGFESVVAWVRSSGDFQVCFNRYLSTGQPCVDVEAMPNGDWLTIHLEDFLIDQDVEQAFTLNDVQSLSFMENNVGTHTLEVSNLMITDEFRPSSYNVQTISVFQQGPQNNDINSDKVSQPSGGSGQGCASSHNHYYVWFLLISLFIYGRVLRREQL